MKKYIVIGIIVLVVIVGGFVYFNIGKDEGNVGSDLTESQPENEEEVLDSSPEPDEQKCSRVFSPQYSDENYYEGELFDAHFHFPILIDASSVEGHDSPVQGHVINEQKNSFLERVACNFEKENLRGVIGFVMGDEVVLEETLDSARAIKEKSSIVTLFLSPPGFSAGTLESIEQTNKGLFEGYGETAFYHPSYSDNPPDSPEMKKIYDVADRNDMVMMIHPDGRQGTEVENAVKDNPGVVFLIHGPEAEGYIVDLISKYDNVYYSLDAILIRLPGNPGALLYTVGGKEEFMTKFSQNYDSMMNDAVGKWKSKIEQYPDRFMWGTDRDGGEWTNSEEISLLLEEFARDFIDKLDVSVQEKFAYQNAEDILR